MSKPKVNKWQQHQQSCPWLLTTGMCAATKDFHFKCSQDFCAPWYWVNLKKKVIEVAEEVKDPDVIEAENKFLGKENK